MGKPFYQKAFALGVTALLLFGCTSGLSGGSIDSQFTGITAANIKGPENVQINWNIENNCVNYQIFDLSASSTSSIASSSVPPITVQYPNVQPEHTYTFAVGCVDATGTISGLATSLTATTWAQFNGNVTSSTQNVGTTVVANLSWIYPTSNVAYFLVYDQISTIPGDLTSQNNGTGWELTAVGGNGSTGYQQTPLCQVTTNSVSVGPGGTCGPSLLSGTSYNFKVVAVYPDGSYSIDLGGNGTNVQLPSSFTPPKCVLTQTGIGPDTTAALELRCGSNATVGTCSINNMKYQAFQTIGTTRYQISSPQTGPGIMQISPRFDPTKPNDRLVTGLEIDYTCTSVTPNAVATVRYDGTNGSYPQPYLKYNRAGYETALPASYANNPSYLGSAFAIGDFDCDGKPDLAIGLPKMSLNQAPYNNTNPESGAIAIYCDYKNSLLPGSNSAPQYISFRDLPRYSHFGQSLSAGNINKDIVQDTSTSPPNYYSCDDLIVGAPGSSDYSIADLNGNIYTGQAFIFYGNQNRFTTPIDYLSITPNAPTCSSGNGGFGSSCSPARLEPQMYNYFHVDPAQTGNNGVIQNFGGTISRFGFSVSYIRDFNADGYGDIAIGDPYCAWDGGASNGSTFGTPQNDILDVGCVYVYWGGPQGLNQNVQVGHSPNWAGTATTTQFVFNSPFIKVYPPFPQSGMHFGWSIGAGGDVDGRLPVPALVQTAQGSKTILASGNDFVVGAPDYVYPNSGETDLSTQQKNEEGAGPTTLTWKVNEAITQSTCQNFANSGGTGCPIDPIVLQGVASYVGTGNPLGLPASPKVTPPWNGAWQPTFGNWSTQYGVPPPSNVNLQKSTGIAFVYLGRSAYAAYPFANSGNFTELPLNLSTTTVGFTHANGIIPNLAASLYDRQGLSGQLGFVDTSGANWIYAPTDSFYNCGPRGGSFGTSSSPVTGGIGDNNNQQPYTFKHISCLAGRNNFSVLYPVLNSSTDVPVTKFGLNVAVAGAAEQNAVAILQNTATASFTTSSAPYATHPIAGTSNSKLSAFSHYSATGVSSIQSEIMGSSLWEIGINDLTTQNLGSGCSSLINNSNSAIGPSTFVTGTITPSGATPCLPVLSRSIIDESYANTASFENSDANGINSLPSSITLPYGVTPISDINKDGYADIIVSATQTTGTTLAPIITGKVYTFFGNYAADFSYHGDQNASVGSCNVARNAAPAVGSNGVSGDAQSILTTSGFAGADPSPSPYSTYYARYALESCASASGACGGNNSSYYYEITGQYPESFLLQPTEFVRASYLDDTTTSTAGTALDFAYQTNIVASRAVASSSSAYAKTNCLPEVINLNYNASASSLAVGDLNGDGIMDVVIGVSGASNQNGTSIIYNGSPDGLLSSSIVPVNSTYANFGSGAVAANWVNPSGTPSRDLIIGATGYQSGTGGAYYYSANNNGTLNSVLSTPVTNTLNFPNFLRVEQSKIIGDVNGDGYDDIWVPVKRFDPSGNIYFDAVIYFGSPYGPITYNTCMANSLASQAGCSGSSTPQTVTWGSVPVLLPQYIAKPTSVSPSWALKPFAAGDVNGDTYQDVVFFDAQSSGNTAPQNMYLFFGSSNGLLVSQPTLGASLNRAPQKVSGNYDLVGDAGAGPAGNPFWTEQVGVRYTWTNYSIVHGDFNGDGFEDIAFAQTAGLSPHISNSGVNGFYCPYPTTTVTVYEKYFTSVSSGFDPCVPPSDQVISGPYTEADQIYNGYVVVLYGGAGGYQTPTDSNGNAAEFPTVDETCNNFMSSCTPPTLGTNNPTNTANTTLPRNTWIHDVYGSLSYSSSSYQLNTSWASGSSTNTVACTPSGSANVPANCSGISLIRNPVFYDVAGAQPSAIYEDGMRFGYSLSVADINGDGVDDLIIGSPYSFHPAWGTIPGNSDGIFGVSPASLLGSITKVGAVVAVSDTPGKGAAFIYYGAKGIGVVAPSAQSMLGNSGMGISTTLSAGQPIGSDAIPSSSPVFQLYPEYYPTGTATTLALDVNEQNRNFGVTMTSGDFNGDGYDDVAIVSGNGQVYVYYGPICQLDNSSAATSTMQNNQGRACLANRASTDTDNCGTYPYPSYSNQQCTLLQLNGAYTNPTNTVTSIYANNTSSIPKLYYPQTFTIPNSTKDSLVGGTLLSARPKRNLAGTIVSNPGNINNDQNMASDLIVGASAIQDPNISNAGTTNTSGVGYIYFGHKQPSPTQSTSMNTMPGLYTLGTANYNGSLNALTVLPIIGKSLSSTYYFYSPVLLEPYSPDGVNSNFFVYESSMGNLNGNGTMLMFPSQTINMGGTQANPNTNIVYGGGFKLFY